MPLVTTIDAPLQWVETVATLKLPDLADLQLQYLVDRNNEETRSSRGLFMRAVGTRRRQSKR